MKFMTEDKITLDETHSQVPTHPKQGGGADPHRWALTAAKERRRAEDGRLQGEPVVEGD